MEAENFFSSGYIGSKSLTQQDKATANTTGFGTSTDNYLERHIDLNDQLIRNKPATFFMRVISSSMINAGIFDGDIIIVDRSIQPKSGKIVIALIDGEMLIRRLDMRMNKIRLVPETPKLATIDVSGFSGFKIWGVVIYVVRSV